MNKLGKKLVVNVMGDMTNIADKSLTVKMFKERIKYIDSLPLTEEEKGVFKTFYGAFFASENGKEITEFYKLLLESHFSEISSKKDWETFAKKFSPKGTETASDIKFFPLAVIFDCLDGVKGELIISDNAIDRKVLCLS